MNARTCEGCKFITVENGTQTGCAINKLDRFKKLANATLNSLNIYEFSRVCIYKRNNEWEGDIQAETATPMSYIFILKDFEKLNILAESLKKVKVLNPVWIGIIHTCTANHKEVIEEMNAVGNRIFNVIMQLNETADFDKIDAFYKNIPQGWTLINIVGEELRINALNEISEAINENLKTVAVVKNTNESINGLCFNNFFYRALHGSFPIIDEPNQTMYYKNIIEKVQEAFPDGVYTWEDLNV